MRAQQRGATATQAVAAWANCLPLLLNDTMRGTRSRRAVQYARAMHGRPTNDLDLLLRPVVLVDGHALHRREHVQPAHHLAKHAVLEVEVAAALEGDEELRAVGGLAAVGHAQHAAPRVHQARVDLVLRRSTGRQQPARAWMDGACMHACSRRLVTMHPCCQRGDEAHIHTCACMFAANPKHRDGSHPGWCCEGPPSLPEGAWPGMHAVNRTHPPPQGAC